VTNGKQVCGGKRAAVQSSELKTGGEQVIADRNEQKTKSRTK